MNAAVIAGLFYLLSFRDAETPRLVETPVEVVTEAPKSPASDPTEPNGSGSPGSQEADKLNRALAPPVAPDPHPPAPPQVQPSAAATTPIQPRAQLQAAPPMEPAAAPAKEPAPAPARPAPPPADEAREMPKLVAPPPEPARAAAEEHQTKPANAVPTDDKEDAARHETKPAEVPRVLATSKVDAGFAVPVPSRPASTPADRPASPIAAKEPSATEKLAAVLPMGALPMPASFRSALTGSGTQASTAYKGLVFGKFNRHPEISERARQQKLRGQVVIAFMIGDDGSIQDIGVAQSSGDPRLDALGMELVRAASPFPPPPPDAQRSFTPVLAFGE